MGVRVTESTLWVRNGIRQVHEVVGDIWLRCLASVHLARLLHQTNWLCYVGRCSALHHHSSALDFCWLQDLQNKKPQILAMGMDSLRNLRLRLLHMVSNNLSLEPCPSPFDDGRRAFCFCSIFFALLCDRGLPRIPIWQEKRVQTASLLNRFWGFECNSYNKLGSIQEEITRISKGLLRNQPVETLSHAVQKALVKLKECYERQR